MKIRRTVISFQANKLLQSKQLMRSSQWWRLNYCLDSHECGSLARVCTISGVNFTHGVCRRFVCQRKTFWWTEEAHSTDRREAGKNVVDSVFIFMQIRYIEMSALGSILARITVKICYPCRCKCLEKLFVYQKYQA